MVVMRTTRARSPEKKKAQMDIVIAVGSELFITKGAEGFTMRELARHLDMSPGNLYHYVETKRELWFAIVDKYYKAQVDSIKKIIDEYDGSYVELLKKIAYYYINSAITDQQAYRMMYMIPPPPAESIGPYEQFHEYTAIEFVTTVLKNAMDAEEIGKDDLSYLTYYLWSTLHGAISLYIEMQGTDPRLRPNNFREYADYMIEKIMIQLKM